MVDKKIILIEGEPTRNLRLENMYREELNQGKTTLRMGNSAKFAPQF